MTTDSNLRSVRVASGLTLPCLERAAPRGIPVVLLHGITDSCRSFEPVLPHFPDSMHAVAPSQRGHGGAGLADRYDLRAFSADLASLMDALAFDRAVIVGHSMGSAVAQRFAIDHSDRVLGLVLAGASAAFGRNPALVEFGEQVVRSLADPVDPSVARAFQESTLARPIPAAMLDLFVGETLKVPAAVWQKAWAGLMTADMTDELHRIAAPTLVIWGDRDSVTTRSHQWRILNGIRGARMEVFAGAGHALHWEEPARFASLVSAFATAAAASRAAAA